jgi:Uri superfamily endonuclease
MFIDNLQIELDACTYQLHIRLSRNIKCLVGRLGEYSFPAGHYVYTGSAKRNMSARLKRHLSKEKALRWHIDYLLASRYAIITKVTTSAEAECLLNQHVEGEVLIPGFGASDCKSGCGSHLKYISKLR